MNTGHAVSEDILARDSQGNDQDNSKAKTQICSTNTKICSRVSKIESIIKNTLHNPIYTHEFKTIFEKLGLSKSRIIKAAIEYNSGPDTFENNIYSSLANRAALHINSLITGGWDDEKQKIILQLIQMVKGQKIIDMGFGVPTLYIREYILKQKSRKLTLLDLYKPAFIYAKELLNYLAYNWKSTISFRHGDLNKFVDTKDYDVLIFQDSIEHVANPTECLKTIVSNAKPLTKFIFSIPICPLIPLHNIAWSNEEKVKNWLNKCGLFVEHFHVVHSNPEVDLFAANLEYLRGVIVLASKLK